MKLSSKMERCKLSPFFVFDSYAQQAKAKGIHIYHLNLGQPDILTPKEYYTALREYFLPAFRRKTGNHRRRPRILCPARC